MTRQLRHFIESPRPCSYLPNVEAELEHRLLVDVTPSELEWLLERGYRRFGTHFFRPACSTCDACISTRVVLSGFAPSKSQRRAVQAARHLRVAVGAPRVDAARVALCNAWHASREATRGWSPNEVDPHSYALSFASDHPSAREVSFYDGDELVGVSLCDETPNAWSAAYTFYAPSHARLSLGTASVVAQVALAQSLGKTHLYLGYKVLDCPSLRYKGGFHPQEELVGRPALDETPEWVRVSRA